MIKVVNKYKHSPTEHDFYIGRGSGLGNPFSSKESSKDYVERVDTREEAVSKFEEWIRGRLKSGDTGISKKLISILNHEEEHGEVNLVCFCKPKVCHGDVIKNVLVKIKNNSSRW